MALDPDLPHHTQITELAATNETRAENLNRTLAPTGQQLTFNRQAAILEALADELLGTDTAQRDRFELGWQHQIADSLTQAETDLRHREILRGIGGTN